MESSCLTRFCIHLLNPSSFHSSRFLIGELEMQSLYGKFRLVTKQTFNAVKNIELSKVGSFESRCSTNRCSGFNYERSYLGAAFVLGQMKLFGTIVYPKNRYLTLQFPKGGKNVTCDDYFDNMIVFSDAWWIGTKEENPDELQLQFPKELNKEQHTESDFKGGVGATRDCKEGFGKSGLKSLEREPEKVYLEDELTDSPIDYKDLAKVTPTRHSARTAGKTFKFKESSGDDFIENGDETPEVEDAKVDNETKRVYTSTKTESSFSPSVVEGGNTTIATKDLISSKKTAKAEEHSTNQNIPLVQATLSSMFKKVEEKKGMKDIEDNTNTPEASKRRKKTEGKKSVTESKDQKKQHKVDEDDDDIEEFSSSPEDMSESDEDWTV